MKEESEKVGLKSNIQKTMIIAYGPIISWQIDGKKVEPVTGFWFFFFSLGLQNYCGQWLQLWN